MTEMTLQQISQRIGYLGAASTRLVRAAALAGARVIARHQQDASPVRKGTMKRSIKARAMRVRDGGGGAKAGLDVGRRKDKSLRHESGAHGHLFVSGTDHRYRGMKRVRYGRARSEVLPTRSGFTKRKGYTGKARPHMPSFIKSATVSARNGVITAMLASLRTGIQRTLTRMGE